jgi:hypothetical protein
LGLALKAYSGKAEAASNGVENTKSVGKVTTLLNISCVIVVVAKFVTGKFFYARLVFASEALAKML